MSSLSITRLKHVEPSTSRMMKTYASTGGMEDSGLTTMFVYKLKDEAKANKPTAQALATIVEQG